MKEKNKEIDKEKNKEIDKEKNKKIDKEIELIIQEILIEEKIEEIFSRIFSIARNNISTK